MGEVRSKKTEKISEDEYKKGYRLACQSFIDMPVEVEIPNTKDPMLFPGMFAQVRIPIMKIEQALLVPRDAVLEDARGTYLYVADPSSQTAKRRDVTLEDVGPEEALVAEGLEYGEALVIRGQELLHDGARVQWDGFPHTGSASGTTPT